MEWQSLLDLGSLWAGRDYAQAGQWFRRSLEQAQGLADPNFRARCSLPRKWRHSSLLLAVGYQK